MAAVALGLAVTIAVTAALPLASRCAPRWRTVSSGATRGDRSADTVRADSREISRSHGRVAMSSAAVG
jgi:hypothetical protein